MSFYRKPVQRLSDVWQAVRNDSFLNKQFYIPELQINGDGYHAVQVLTRVIWRIRPEIRQIIEQHKNNLNLGHLPHAGLWIRRGDKINEASYVAVSEYAKKVKELNSDIHRVFIDTDDYRCVEEFKQLNPGWEVFTMCDTQKRGHYQFNFNQQTPVERRREIIQLLTIIDILKESTFFIGTFSSNFARLVGLLKGIETCYSLDANASTRILLTRHARTRL